MGSTGGAQRLLYFGGIRVINHLPQHLHQAAGIVGVKIAGGIAIHEAQERSMLMDLPLWVPYMLMLPGLALCVVIGLVQCVRMATRRNQGGTA